MMVEAGYKWLKICIKASESSWRLSSTRLSPDTRKKKTQQELYSFIILFLFIFIWCLSDVIYSRNENSIKVHVFNIYPFSIVKNITCTPKWELSNEAILVVVRLLSLNECETVIRIILALAMQNHFSVQYCIEVHVIAITTIICNEMKNIKKKDLASI